MNRRFAILCLLIAINAIQISCTGARINLMADNLKYPVSMSEGRYDERLKLVSDNYGYEVVDEFSFSVSRVTTFWSLLSFGFISFGSDEDISAEINKLVKEKGGDGVIDLQVSKNGLFFFTNILAGAASGLGFTLGGLVYATGKKSRGKTVGRNLMSVSLLMPGGHAAICERQNCQTPVDPAEGLLPGRLILPNPKRIKTLLIIHKAFPIPRLKSGVFIFKYQDGCSRT